MTRWLGARRVTLDACDSTNDEAAVLAAQGAAHGTVVIARAQRAGRGRMGRAWHSPPDENLYLSCVLRPACEPRAAPPITLAAGLGVVDAIRAQGAHARLKWPNDVLVGDRKIAGVLTEMSTRGARVEHLIVGIGVNVATRQFPPELADIATSLRLAGVDVTTAVFADGLLAALEVWFERFLAGGVAAIAGAWMERAALGPGEPAPRVRVATREGAVEGRAIGLDPDGRLRVQADDGRIHIVIAGDVADVTT